MTSAPSLTSYLEYSGHKISTICVGSTAPLDKCYEMRSLTACRTMHVSVDGRRTSVIKALGAVAIGMEETTLPNTGKQEKERRACLDYLKYEESRVRIKYGRILKKKKSNYSSFQALRSSCNEDMVKYEDPRPSTTRTRSLNERINKKIHQRGPSRPAGVSAARQRVCRPAGGFAARLFELAFFTSL
ncbi:hypothetical protein Tco_0897004 [Tanacetum coccineum]